MAGAKPTGYVRIIDAQGRRRLLREAEAAGRHPAATAARQRLDEAHPPARRAT